MRSRIYKVFHKSGPIGTWTLLLSRSPVHLFHSPCFISIRFAASVTPWLLLMSSIDMSSIHLPKFEARWILEHHFLSSGHWQEKRELRLFCLLEFAVTGSWLKNSFANVWAVHRSRPDVFGKFIAKLEETGSVAGKHQTFNNNDRRWNRNSSVGELHCLSWMLTSTNVQRNWNIRSSNHRILKLPLWHSYKLQLHQHSSKDDSDGEPSFANGQNSNKKW